MAPAAVLVTRGAGGTRIEAALVDSRDVRLAVTPPTLAVHMSLGDPVRVMAGLHLLRDHLDMYDIGEVRVTAVAGLTPTVLACLPAVFDDATVRDDDTAGGEPPAPAPAVGRVPESAFELEEIHGDLFQSDESLAHCVSKDLRMGKGIAKIFVRQFGRVGDLRAQQAEIGSVAVLRVDGRFVYYLVTKARYSDKPTYEDLARSLEAMRGHCVANGVRRISIPKLGCGLDGLEWPRVRSLIESALAGSLERVRVYIL